MQQSTLPAFSGYCIKIFGPPGSGKTTFLLERLSEEIHSGISPERIAFLSFTTAAARQAEDRSPIQMEWCRTVHSACYHASGLTRNEVFGKEDDVLLARQGYRIVGERSYGALQFTGELVKGHDAILHAYSLARNTERDLDDVIRELAREYEVVRPGPVHRFAKVYEEIKRRRGKNDFDDMLQLVINDPKPLPIDVLFLDETQDFTRMQWRAVHVLGAAAQRIYMAGDDDQSIYSFLGADEYGFLDHPCNEEIVLEHSHRCPRVIGEKADRTIARSGRRREKHVRWQEKPGSIEIAGRFSNSQLTAAAQRTETSMFLQRHRAGVTQMSSFLMRNGVPHYVRGEALNCTRWAEAVRDYIRLQRGERLDKALACNMLDQLGDPTNAKVLRADVEISKVDRDLLLDLESFAQPWQDRFGNRKNKERVRGLGRMLEIHGLGVVGREPNIHVSTMHGVKGAEADHVYISPACNERSYRNARRMVPAEVRLAYVALTRARQTVTISRPDGDKFLRTLFL